jgi:hypothetical protein
MRCSVDSVVFEGPFPLPGPSLCPLCCPFAPALPCPASTSPANNPSLSKIVHSQQRSAYSSAMSSFFSGIWNWVYETLANLGLGAWWEGDRIPASQQSTGPGWLAGWLGRGDAGACMRNWGADACALVVPGVAVSSACRGNARPRIDTTWDVHPLAMPRRRTAIHSQQERQDSVPRSRQCRKDGGCPDLAVLRLPLLPAAWGVQERHG